ncbi:hypothetical protein D3C76_952230 [compost metagenome]
MPEIIGSRMRRLFRPSLALSMARVCTRKISGWSRVTRMPRQPRNGFSSLIGKYDSDLSPPMSRVRMVTGSGWKAASCSR